jgi:hypothetical protein
MHSFLGNLVKIPYDWQCWRTWVRKICQIQFVQCSSRFEDGPGGRLRPLLPTKRNAYPSNAMANTNRGRRTAMMNEVIRIKRQDQLGLAIEINRLLQIYLEALPLVALPLVDRFRPNVYRSPPLALEVRSTLFRSNWDWFGQQLASCGGMACLETSPHFIG